MRRFQISEFVEACRAAAAGPDAEPAIRELVVEAISDRRALELAFGDPQHAGIETLYRGPDLTVINFTWAPWLCLKPHNHNMWAVVAIFSGREDNVFWRRTEQSIEAAGARSLGAGEVTPLGRDVIHSVTNPIGKMSRAIHVYGGDFFAPPQPRSEWDHETLIERPWDIEDTRRQFADAEARFRSTAPNAQNQ